MPPPAPVTLGGYWINDYRRPPNCARQRGLEQTNYCDSLVDGFVGAMRARGHRWLVHQAEEFASPKQWRWATDSDPGGVDTVDFAYLATHGNTWGVERSGGGWVHWVSATFNSPDGCRWTSVDVPPQPSNPLPALLLGEGRLRWVVLDLCRSLQVGHENEENIGADPDRFAQLRDALPGTTWTRCFAGVHIIFGFTGLSSDAWWTRNRGARFGRRAGAGEALAESWLEEAHDWSRGDNDAPVALAWGRSEDDARRRLTAESLSRPEPTLAPGDIQAAHWMWRV
jgi:Family of unknown function (DUF6345)